MVATILKWVNYFSQQLEMFTSGVLPVISSSSVRGLAGSDGAEYRHGTVGSQTSRRRVPASYSSWPSGRGGELS